MAPSVRYFIEMQTFCEECGGIGSKRSRPPGLTRIGIKHCSKCGGKGCIAGKRELELASAPNGTGFILAPEPDED